MTKLEILKSKLTKEQDDFLFGELTYNKETFEEIVAALESDEIEDRIHEIADSNVNVYTYNQLEWLTNNWATADQEEAIACGAKNAQEIAAFCWYQANVQECNEMLQKIKDIVEEINEAE